ncbi:tRNA adenosine(34) deaminase TadA [Thiomicrorhabdus sediminis]|uniref:tRNA-specific adenosine deaminase n=1 Tax=Thiomicrorhabdus sediminis TaxID=2580412 RepID=A0A4P9K462_9GAMM|nr:tRNA adenosine(34) deaminase TadA [Thiomicrorhabdus sediminis]QCU89709.1 tRNA adenosine(34) deaminase TadA [Thiomicrorhabdus sediminis]
MQVPEGLTAQQIDEFWMNHARKLAEKAEQSGEVPVGAVVVLNGELISEAYNQPIQNNDPTAHAEVLALRAAGKKLGNYRLIDTTLYVTLEPCPMCAGAMVHARVKRVVFGAYDAKTGAAGSVFDLLQAPQLNHVLQVDGGIMQFECADQLSAFFKRRRKEIKAQKRLGQTTG